MTAIKAGDADRALASRPPAIVLLLFYGPDTGLVSERARHEARRAVSAPDDPFQLIRIDGDRLAEDPGRLADEVSTFGLFGEQRSIWVRPTTRNIAPAIEACLAAKPVNVTVVVEAGDLAKTSPLRAVCERSPVAYALPCYEDEGRGLQAVIDRSLRAAGMRISPPAAELLAASLGGDRLATQGEIDKLILYVGDAREITEADIEAVVSDVSAAPIDAVLDAGFTGRQIELDAALDRLWTDGVQPAQLLGAMSRHVTGLLGARLQIEAGRPADVALLQWRGLHFRRKASVGRQIRIWTSADLTRMARRIGEATLDTRRHPSTATAIVGTLLYACAARAASGEGAKRAP